MGGGGGGTGRGGGGRGCGEDRYGKRVDGELAWWRARDTGGLIDGVKHGGGTGAPKTPTGLSSVRAGRGHNGRFGRPARRLRTEGGLAKTGDLAVQLDGLEPPWVSSEWSSIVVQSLVGRSRSGTHRCVRSDRSFLNKIVQHLSCSLRRNLTSSERGKPFQETLDAVRKKKKQWQRESSDKQVES